MPRLEPIAVALFLVCWSFGLLSVLGIVDMRGNLELGLYPYFAIAAACGWLAGNVYVARSRSLSLDLKRRLRIIYYVGPPGLLFLLRAMAPAEVQARAPMVPVYAFGVFSVLFLVPVVLTGRAPERRRLRIGDREDE